MPIDEKFVGAIADLTTEGFRIDIETVELPGVAPEEQAAGKRYFVMVPKEHELKDVTDTLLRSLPNPQYRSGTVAIADLGSFAAFVKRMKEESSVLFADKKKQLLRCVFDYHEAVNDSADDQTGEKPNPENPALPRWGRFKADFSFPVSEPWKRWAGKNKTAMGQGDLAEWLEANILDVLDPEGMQPGKNADLIGQLGLRLAGRAALLKAARGMEVTASERIEQAVNTSTGEHHLTFSETHSTGGQPAALSVPSAFIVGLPVFEGGEWYQLLVRLRYRKSSGQLVWSYDIYQLDRAVEDAFTSACEATQKDTGLALFYANLGAAAT